MTKRTVFLVCTLVCAFSFLVSTSALAQTGVLFVKNNNVGVHTSNPVQEFHLNDGPDTNANGAFRISTASHAWDFATINNIGAFRISKLGTGTSEFTLAANGALTITGSLKTGGTTCGGGGCDLVFQPGTDLLSLREHADSMWALGYLPAVGPTPEMMPINLTEKVGGILHELELSHIYIEQLHQRLETSDDVIANLRAENSAIQARLQLIEKLLSPAPAAR